MESGITIIDKDIVFNPYHEVEGLREGEISETRNHFSDLLVTSFTKYDWFTGYKISNNVFALDICETKAPLWTDYLQALDDVLNELRKIPEKKLIIFQREAGFVFNPEYIDSLKSLEDYEAAIGITESLYDVVCELPEKGAYNDNTQYWTPSKKHVKKWWHFW